MQWALLWESGPFQRTTLWPIPRRAATASGWARRWLSLMGASFASLGALLDPKVRIPDKHCQGCPRTRRAWPIDIRKLLHFFPSLSTSRSMAIRLDVLILKAAGREPSPPSTGFQSWVYFRVAGGSNPDA